MPDDFFFLGKLPTATRSGKLDRRKLPTPKARVHAENTLGLGGKEKAVDATGSDDAGAFGGAIEDWVISQACAILGDDVENRPTISPTDEFAQILDSVSAARYVSVLRGFTSTKKKKLILDGFKVHSANVTIAHLFSATTNTPRTLAAHIKSESSPASEADYLLDGQSEDDEAGNNTFRRNVGQERWWHRCSGLFARCMAAVSRVPRAAPFALVGEPCNDGILCGLFGGQPVSFYLSAKLCSALQLVVGQGYHGHLLVCSVEQLADVRTHNMNEMLPIVLAFSALLL